MLYVHIIDHHCVCTVCSFRLSPEEQEIAYELKASMFRKLEEQTARVDAEMQLHQSLQEAQLVRSKSATVYHNQVDMSRANAIKLMKLYERQTVKGYTLKLYRCNTKDFS